MLILIVLSFVLLAQPGGLSRSEAPVYFFYTTDHNMQQHMYQKTYTNYNNSTVETLQVPQSSILCS